MKPKDIYNDLLAAAKRGAPAAAIRITEHYEPVAGAGGRVFPPTYPDVRYLIEERHHNGERREAIALDSVQSQSNRVEEALLELVDDNEVQLPYLSIDQDVDGGHFRITSLDAPHRSPDAYFRDSVTDDGTSFDKSDLGKRLRSATGHNARVFLENTPTDLLLGIWDSQRGGRGLRLPRAYTSEIVAYDPIEGKRAAGRLDPYNMQSGEIYYDKSDKGDWAFDKADVDAKNVVKGKPSNVLHGNALSGPDSTPGGVSVGEIERIAVLSLGVLRRLRFPDADGVVTTEADAAARAYLAALGLMGDRVAFSESSVFLRSGADLVRTDSKLEWVESGGSTEPFELSAEEAIELYQLAYKGAQEAGFNFADELRLKPAKNLLALIELNLATPPLEDE